MCQIHNFRSRPCLHGNRQARAAAAAGPANPWGFYLGCVFVRAAAAVPAADPTGRQPNGSNSRNRTLGPRGNNSDRCQWQEEGAVVGAALRFLQAPDWVRRKNQPAQEVGCLGGACWANPGGGPNRSRFRFISPGGGTPRSGKGGTLKGRVGGIKIKLVIKSFSGPESRPGWRPPRRPCS